MLASLRAFLEGIIDYAGLFPPAELPLDQAAANYLRYRAEPDSWMLGRFVCPAARLKDLPNFRDRIGSAPLRLTVLGGGGANADEFTNNLKMDCQDIGRLDAGIAVAESYEVKLPPVLPPTLDSVRHAQVWGLMRGVAEVVDLVPYLECPWSELARIDEFAEGMRRIGPRGGWKLRCGGLQASAFPSCGMVARVLTDCCAAGVGWKATAGLHHPLRHFDSALQTTMHGFLNVFGAGILAHAGKIDRDEMEAMLSDEDASHFAVNEAGFAWNGQQVGTEEIRLARQQITSFGSCSFDEPRDGLRRLGWL